MGSLEECMLEALTSKRELLGTIAVQMTEDVNNGVLSPDTIRQHSIAVDNLDAAAIWLEKCDYAQAMHFYSRGCSNMGEFKGRADKERKKS